MKKIFCRLWKNEKGVTAIEFAALAFPLCMLLFAVIEFSLIMFAGSTLEAATGYAARIGKTLYNGEGNSFSYERLIVKNKQHDRATGILNPKKILLTYTATFSFAHSANCPDDEDKECFKGYRDNGTFGEVVTYTATYPWPVTPFLGSIIEWARPGTLKHMDKCESDMGCFPLKARVVVKNEGYFYD